MGFRTPWNFFWRFFLVFSRCFCVFCLDSFLPFIKLHHADVQEVPPRRIVWPNFASFNLQGCPFITSTTTAETLDIMKRRSSPKSCGAYFASAPNSNSSQDSEIGSNAQTFETLRDTTPRPLSRDGKERSFPLSIRPNTAERLGQQLRTVRPGPGVPRNDLV